LNTTPTDSPRQRLVLLGGGHAHLFVLEALARAPWPGVEVLLISPFTHTLYSGMVPGLVAGHYEASECSLALPPLAQAAGARWEQAAASGLDAARRQVHLADGRVAEYGLLSINTGSDMPRDSLPGAREHALFLRPMEHFTALLPRLWERVAQSPPDVAVVGAGAAGVELALALAHRLQGRSHVALVTGGPPPLAGYPPAVQDRVRGQLQRAGITVLPAACVEVQARHVLLAGGTRLPCALAVLATGGQAPAWLAGSGLALSSSGHVAVGATQQSTSHPEVFAAGDVATRVDHPHAKSGVYAVRAGPALARNLQALLAGQALVPYRPPAHTLNLISCGRRYAIAHHGNWSAQGRWVWWCKRHIDRRFVQRFSRSAGT
jgi:pyridine nucleotide-disulfide oxidoreductase family protein